MLLAVHRPSYKLQLNIINTLLQVQTMHYGKPSIDDDERVLMVTFPRDMEREQMARQLRNCGGFGTI